MKYKLLISDEAENDVEEAFIWYELQKIDLGFDFFKSIENGLKIINDFPRRFPIVHRNVRRCLVKKFPFCIYYYIDEVKSQIKVIAVFHTSRNPKIWKRRK